MTHYLEQNQIKRRHFQTRKYNVSVLDKNANYKSKVLTRIQRKRREFRELILDFRSLYPIDKALHKAVVSHIVKLILLNRKISTTPTGNGKAQPDMIVSDFL